MAGGYNYGEAEPTEKCPYCGEECNADFVDVGIGYTQCGPYHCMECGASEIGPNDEPRPLTDKEKKCWWYAPGTPPGSSANTIDGVIVDHKTADAFYRAGYGVGPRETY